MSEHKENPNSEYRGISWKDARGLTQSFRLGQSPMVIDSVDGKKLVARIYSIDDTSYRLGESSEIVHRYTISVITDNGEVVDHCSIVNGANVTLFHNHSKWMHV